MKKLCILALALLLAVSLAACKTQPDAEQPAAPVVTTAPQAEATQDPFEFESQIDFSDFSTEPVSTEPVQTEPEEPRETVPEEPKPAPTQPAETEPEQTDPPETAAPVYEPDGYNSQIVRP